jgi:hypothetical protein
VGALAGACLLLGAGGCAAGSSTLSQQDAASPPQDASLPQQDANAPADAAADSLPQQDANAPADAAADSQMPADGPQDGPPQQDAQHDAQQDVQQDMLPQSDVLIDTAPQCAVDSDCYPDSGVPDSGIYCFLPKGACYVPGACTSDWECRTGAVCKPMFQQCSCSNSLPPLLCRDHEICIPLFQTCGLP